MATLTFEIPDAVLSEAVQSAIAAEIDLDELIIARIVAGADQDSVAPVNNFDVDSVARAIYQEARTFKVGDEFTVEELHRLKFGTAAWKTHSAGQRIALGRAFRKLAEAREPVLNIAEFPIGFVAFERKDAQNRAIYSFQNHTSRPR